MRYIMLLGFFFVVMACNPAPSSNDPAMSANQSEKQLNALIDEVESLRRKPFPFDKGAPDRDPRTKPASLSHESEWYDYVKDKKSVLDAIDKSKLSQSSLIDLRIYQYLLDDDIAAFEDEHYLIPLNAEGGFHTSFGFGPAGTYINTAEDAERYLTKLNGFGTTVDQQIVLMRIGLKKGKTLPSAILDGYESTVESYIVDDPKESIFYKPFLAMGDKVEHAMEIQKRGEAAIQKSVLPGYRTLLKFMKDEYFPGARKSLGVSEMDGGKKLYEQRVRHFTTMDISPDEVFQIGQNEVARISQEMQSVLDEVGFKGSIKDFIDFLRTDPKFYAKTGEELLEFASRVAKIIDGKLPAYFGTLPRQSYGVEPVPDEIAPRYTGGRYKPGRMERGESGTYWVNTYKLDSRPLYVIPSLTLHEAVPGHHLQMALTKELEHLPKFRRNLYISAYGEGWALYCEFLGDEMGIYRTPYEQFGKLSYEMWRACRLVVDVGMHYKGWTKDQAVQYMADRTALSLHEVNTEIDRYIGWPGQALSYKMGEIHIRNLRQKAEKELGSNFDLRDFHNLILSEGAVPLFVLEEMVDRFIEEKGKEMAD